MCLQFKLELFFFSPKEKTNKPGSVGVNFSGRNRPCNLVCSEKFKVLYVIVTEVRTWDTVLGKTLSVSSAQFQIDLTSHPLRSFPLWHSMILWILKVVPTQRQGLVGGVRGGGKTVPFFLY